MASNIGGTCAASDDTVARCHPLVSVEAMRFRSAKRADYVGGAAIGAIVIVIVEASLGGHDVSVWTWLAAVLLVVLGLSTVRGCRVTVGSDSVRVTPYLAPGRTIRRQLVSAVDRRRDGIGFIDASGKRLAWCPGFWDAKVLERLRSAVLANGDVVDFPHLPK